MEELDPNMVPNCILPALKYNSGSKKLKDAIQKLIGAVAESKFDWYSHPERYILNKQEYKFPDSDKDIPKDIAYTGKSPSWLFKQGIVRLGNIKVGGEYIVGRGDEQRYADYVEATYHREHQKTRND